MVALHHDLQHPASHSPAHATLLIGHATYAHQAELDCLTSFGATIVPDPKHNLARGTYSLSQVTRMGWNESKGRKMRGKWREVAPMKALTTIRTAESACDAKVGLDKRRCRDGIEKQPWSAAMHSTAACSCRLMTRRFCRCSGGRSWPQESSPVVVLCAPSAEAGMLRGKGRGRGKGLGWPSACARPSPMLPPLLMASLAAHASQGSRPAATPKCSDPPHALTQFSVLKNSV